MIPELEKAVESMKKNERSIFDINSLKFDIKLIDFYKIEHKNYWDYDNERERLINANLLIFFMNFNLIRSSNDLLSIS